MSPINLINATSRTAVPNTKQQESTPTVESFLENPGNQPTDENSKLTERLSLTEEKHLTTREKLELKQLQQTDRSIREHEEAHLRAARNIGIGQPNFEFKLAADGEKYAVRGEVSIDFSSVSGDAKETIEKAKKMQNAALAPSDPSPKDLQAAAQARIMENKAHRKLAREEALDQTFKKEEEESAQTNPGIKAYDIQLNYQKNLYNILDLFS